MRTILTALALATLLLVGASAQQSPPAPSTPADIAAEQASMMGYGDRNKTCTAWTDGCMNCSRASNGDPVCGNIGFACQPKAISCTDPTAPPPAKQ